ncbi:MAG: glutathione S-transferase family protein [Alphaproteobacteria bacterium]
MLTLFGNLESGNVHKIQMILKQRAVTYRLVDVAQSRGEPRSPQFLALNPMGKVPAVLFEDGDMLSDSGALLFYFARGTALWPGEARAQAEVLRWMFFEQYNHEPALSILRYLRRFARGPGQDLAKQHQDRLRDLTPKACHALDVMEVRLAQSDWLVGAAPSIADYALYPYTRTGNESGLDLAEWSAVTAWLARVEGLPKFLPMYANGAVETVAFEDYFHG